MTGWILLNRFKRGGRPRQAIGVPNTLSGSFDFRGNRIVGWVADPYDAASMQIDIFQCGHLLERLAATPQPAHRRFAFSLPTEGRFTGAEVIKEEISIVARDTDGNTGRILLNGATQLELIRDHLGVPATTILDLDFSHGGNARPYLGAGWSAQEPDFIWTEDHDSFINFDTPSEPGTYAVRIMAGALIRRPVVSAQVLNIFVNGTQIGTRILSEAHTQFNECRFLHDAFDRVPQTTLRLHHPDAVRPCDLGPSQERRRLALCIKRLSLARLLSPE